MNIKWLLYVLNLAVIYNSYSIDKYYKQYIAELVKNNPGQLTVDEYELIAEAIAAKSPCNLLVFGVGKDSELWMSLNNKGLTIFIEDNMNWLKIIKNKIPYIKAYLVRYNTQLKNWQTLLYNPNRELLKLDLPTEVLNVPWDVIFVDAPNGYADHTPGRMKSIYMASLFAFKGKKVDVFVHDCDRLVEKVYCDAFLLKENLLKTVNKRLRHYCVNRTNN